MATMTTYHAQLIKYDSSGNQSILNLKNTGDDVSISRNSNGNLPSTVTSAQTLANAFGSLAFKSAVAWSDVSGLASTELTVSSEGKLADAGYIDFRDYDAAYFYLAHVDRYRVDSTFPRLRRHSAPVQVLNAKYQLDLATLDAWRK